MGNFRLARVIWLGLWLRDAAPEMEDGRCTRERDSWSWDSNSTLNRYQAGLKERTLLFIPFPFSSRYTQKNNA